MALRRFFLTLCGLVVLGHLGLYLAIIDFDRTSTDQARELGIMQSQWEGMKNEVVQAERRLNSADDMIRTFDQTQYKLTLFRKRYPDFAKIVDEVCQKSQLYGFHPDLIMGIIQIESNFNPAAVSLRGALGLMQVQYWVWKDELKIDRERIFEIGYNIDLGLQVLKRYLRETGGDIKEALLRYNNGYTYANLVYPDKINQTAFCLNQNLSSLVTDAQ